MYGLSEKQFHLFFERAERQKGITGTNLLVLLERRLDNVVYRLGFTNSRAQARQFVATVASALAVKQDDPSRWRQICDLAAQQRFTWEDAARQYLVRLYAN